MNIKQFAHEALMQQAVKPIRILYLDLDGTVRHRFDEMGRFVNGPEDVVVFPEAIKQMRRFKKAGWKIAAISNQGGIALGHMTIEVCSAAMMRTHDLCAQMFDCISFCRHHPQAHDPYMANCWCRKPRIGLIIEAARSICMKFDGQAPPHLALFVGDRPEDKSCAENAGIRFMDAKEWREGKGDPHQ